MFLLCKLLLIIVKVLLVPYIFGLPLHSTMMQHETQMPIMNTTVDIEQLQPISRTYQYRKVIIFWQLLQPHDTPTFPQIYFKSNYKERNISTRFFFSFGNISISKLIIFSIFSILNVNSLVLKKWINYLISLDHFSWYYIHSIILILHYLNHLGQSR